MLLALFFVCNVATATHAVTDVLTSSDYSASGGSTITADVKIDTDADGSVTDESGRIIEIMNVLAMSDTASAVVTIQKADAVGATDNYTTVGTLDVGNATKEYGTGNQPIFTGVYGRDYRLTLDSSTANSLIVNYRRR